MRNMNSARHPLLFFACPNLLCCTLRFCSLPCCALLFCSFRLTLLYYDNMFKVYKIPSQNNHFGATLLYAIRYTLGTGWVTRSSAHLSKAPLHKGKGGEWQRCPPNTTPTQATHNHPSNSSSSSSSHNNQKRQQKRQWQRQQAAANAGLSNTDRHNKHTITAGT